MKRLLFTLLIISMLGLACASFISISPLVQVESVIAQGDLQVNISVTNSGDEAAHDVFVSILPGMFSSDAVFFGRLAPNSPMDDSLTLSVNASPGSYAVPFMVEYKDANGHPFSSVNVFSVVVEEPAFSHVSARVSEISISDSEESLSVKLKNLDAEQRDVKLELLLPNELSASDTVREVAVPGKSELEVTFQVSSFDALPGSNYAVFALVSYESDGMHHSSFASNIIHIVSRVEDAPDSFSAVRENLLFWAMAGILLLLFATFVFYQVRR